MVDKSEMDQAVELYQQGMQYNWRQNESPANAVLSRASLQQATNLGHVKAARELAEMVFVGAGGPRNPEQALALKWSAFIHGETDSLEELSALLSVYAEELADSTTKNRISRAASKADEAYEQLRYVGGIIDEICRSKLTQ